MKHLPTLILSLIVSVGMAGCSQSVDKKFGDRPGLIDSDSTTYEIVVIDHCQYIYRQNNGYQQGPIFTHKGNCNNPIHKIH